MILFLEMIIYGGINNSNSVYLIPIVEELGCCRGGYSLTTSTKAIVGVVTTAMAGLLFRLCARNQKKYLEEEVSAA